MLFFTKELERQIIKYVEWKARNYPLLAKTHERVLNEFFRAYRLPDATQITSEHIQDFVNQQSSMFYQQQYLKVLRGFMRYWYKIGLLHDEFALVVKRDIITDMETVHPLLHVNQVTRVKKLRAEHLSFRAIKALMEAEDKRVYDIHSIHRWANYTLSTGS